MSWVLPDLNTILSGLMFATKEDRAVMNAHTYIVPKSTIMESFSKQAHGKLACLDSVMPALSATFIYREVFELERRGFKVHIYSLHRPDPAKLSAESLPLYTRAYYLLPITLPDLIDAHAHYAFLHPLRYIGTLWRMLIPSHHRFKDRIRTLFHFGEGVVLAREMQKDAITHVHAQYISHPASVARVIYLLTGIPYSISAHTYDIWHERLLLPEKLGEARFVACCSEAARAELIKHGQPAHASKVHLVYHGVDTRRFIIPSDDSRSHNLILSIGRLDPVKGFVDLIHACAELEKKGIDFRCEIVGEGPEREHLSALINQNHLTARVVLQGAVPQEKILDYYHRAAVFVLPCLTMQGIPNVLVEAMASGLPVVSTSFSGVIELVENGVEGFLVQPGSPRELAERLKQLLQDPELRQKIGNAARAKACASFDNRTTIEPLTALLRKAVDSQGPIVE